MYSSVDILQAMSQGSITISDFDITRLGANSYDVRLGHYFFRVVWDVDGPWYIGPMVCNVGDIVHVPVGGTLLAMTADIIGTKGKIVAEMSARSTTGREGITVCKCAGLGDIGYCNHWTMELTAFSSQGQPFVRVGDSIAQVTFTETKTEPTSFYQGQYNIDDWPICMIPKKWRHRISNI